MKKICFILVLLLAFAGSVCPAQAFFQEKSQTAEAFDVSLHAGYQNVCRPGKHIPLTARLTSRKDFSGWLRWIVPGTQGVSSFAVEKAVQTKAGEAEIIRTLAAPQWRVGTLRFQLLDAGRRVLLEEDVPVEYAEEAELLIGILSDDLQSVRSLDGVNIVLQNYYGCQTRIVKLTPDSFPENAAGLEGIGLLAADPQKVEQLDPAQQALFRDWQDKDRPLIVLDQGSGTAWEDVKECLLAHASWAESTLSTPYGFYSYYFVSDFLEDRFHVQAPDYTWMILLLIFFCLLICPVMYLILKRLDRREWYLAAVPLAALLTTVLLFAAYRDLRIRGPRESMLVQTEYDPAEQEEIRHTYSLLLSPERGKTSYSLNAAAGDLTVYTAKDVDYYDPDFRIPEINFDYSFSLVDEERTTGLTVDNRKPFAKTWAETVSRPEYTSPGLEVHLSRTIGGLKGEITNQTGYDLSMVSVFTAERAVLVGTMKQGETITFDRSVDLQSVLNRWDEVKMPGETLDSIEYEQKKSLMGYMLLDRLYELEEDEAITYYYVGEYPEALCADQEVRHSGAASFLRKDRILYEEYPEACSVRLQDHLDETSSSIDQTGQMLDTEAEAIYRLPGTQVLAFLRAESMNGDSSGIRVLFYNWKTESFDEVFADEEKVVPDPSPYVREDGVVRARFLSGNIYDYVPVLRAVMKGGTGDAEG